ncbi:hypothetical protein NSTC731_02006 [Nostoc sp. DSM 114167]|jgi:hypothetical protein
MSIQLEPEISTSWHSKLNLMYADRQNFTQVIYNYHPVLPLI